MVSLDQTVAKIARTQSILGPRYPLFNVWECRLTLIVSFPDQSCSLGMRLSPTLLTCGAIAAPMAVAVARSETGNQTSEKRGGAPQMSPLLIDAIV